MRTHSCVRIAFVLLTIGLSIGEQGHQTPSRAAETRPAINEVLRAWKNRQDSVHSARFEWEESFTQAAWALPDLRLDKPTRDRPRRRSPGSTRQASFTHIVRRSLVFDGTRVRQTRDGKMWNESRGEFLDESYVNVFDGDRSIGHYRKLADQKRDADSTAFVGKIGYQEKSNYHVEPIMLHYRALDPVLSPFQASELTATEKLGIVDGHGCVVLEKPVSGGAFVEQYWVDPERDFSIVRYTTSRGSSGPVIFQVDVSYKQDPTHGWVLSDWRASLTSSRRGMREGTIAKITSYALNAPVAAEEFQYELPPNTSVADARDGSDYILREGGRKEMISGPQGDGSRSFGALRLWLALGFLILAVVGGAVVYRRRKRRRGRT
jgi:hypothetical protein